MKVYRAESLTLSGSVVAIGAFDGVHRGHQSVIREMVRKGNLEGVPTVVYTFSPPPRVYFQGARTLTSPEQKLTLLERLGVTHTILAKFDEEYVKRTAMEFVEELSLINPKCMIVGDDFRFGNNRAGDVSLLKSYFNVQSINPICCARGERISSTRIRELIVKGKQEQVLPLLGWM